MIAPRAGRIDAGEVKRRHPIAGVVSRYVRDLRPAGAALVGRCPFHRDRGRPNFHVYPASDRWICYRCGARGDAIDFLRRIEGVGFREAVARLEGGPGAGATPPRPTAIRPLPATPAPAGVTEPVARACLEAAVKVYARRLLAEPAALAYCAGRGLDRAALARGRLGFAAGDDLLPELRRRRLPPAAAVRAGLLVERPGGGHREFLAGRVVIPELRPRGPLWLVGRALVDRPSRSRYLGLRAVKKPLLGFGLARGGPVAYVTEGPFDLLTLAGWGLPAVALVGTHPRPEVLRALARFPQLFLALDDDDAGHEGTAALLDALGPRALPVALPGVKDVAELATRPDGESLFRDACAAAFRQQRLPLAA